MSEMIERVARAIFDAAEKYGEYVGDYQFHKFGDHLETTLDGQFDLSVFARAAIEAMWTEIEKHLRSKANLYEAYGERFQADDPTKSREMFGHHRTVADDIRTTRQLIDAALKEGA